MKKIIAIAAALLMTLNICAQDLFVGSYNIRYVNDKDSIKGNVWTKRCQVICDQLNFEQPDIFGTQECYIQQIHDLEARLVSTVTSTSEWHAKTERKSASTLPFSTKKTS